MANPETTNNAEGTEKPPVFPTWNHWYVLLMATLVVLAALFVWLGESYS